MSDTDLELLARYARDRADEAFAELVRRHLDLVHSAALRQVRSPQLAEEVAQSTFLKLTQHARQLAPGTVLSAWLYQVTRREAIDVVRREARRQLREQIATEMNAMNATTADWTHIEPLLDDAMHALDETDRTAVLLRYFENKSLREIGQALGASENAAQKRLTRAVEQLRDFFVKRGIGVGASSLVAVIGTNAVQAAPVGLAVTISTAFSLAGATAFTTATATTAKAIAMTTLQKSLVTAALAVASVTTIYQARQAAVWRAHYMKIHDQAGEQLQQAQRERDDADRRLAALSATQGRLDEATTELIKLRGEVSRLQQLAAAAKPPKEKQGANSNPTTGFGTLGNYLAAEHLSDAGNATGEALLQTMLWALKEGNVKRLESVGAPFGGQSSSGDVVGELSPREAAAFQMTREILTNAVGFRLSSKPMPNTQGVAVQLDAVSRDGSGGFYKNANLTFYLEPNSTGWGFVSPPQE